MSNLAITDLRVGNLVIFKYKIHTLIKVCDYGRIGLYDGKYSIDTDMDLISGIPLTEEWLIRMGFDKDKDDNCFYLIEDEIEIMAYNFETKSLYLNSIIVSNIEYVHKIQNIHYAIFDFELTIKGE